MTETQLKNKLGKIAELAVRGSTSSERASATDKLHRLCRKHNARLADYVQGLAPRFANIDYHEVEPLKIEEKPQFSKKASRRSLIIGYINRGGLTTRQIANFLTSQGYPNKKANKKAVAGTIYDMQKNKGWDIRRSQSGHIRRVV